MEAFTERYSWQIAASCREERLEVLCWLGFWDHVGGSRSKQALINCQWGQQASFLEPLWLVVMDSHGHAVDSLITCLQKD